MKKNINILIKDHIILINYEDEFATLTRRQDSGGLREIQFSIPLKISYADVIDTSGIAEVETVDLINNKITIKSKPFYETHLMIELITDIFKRHETHCLLN